VLTSLGYALGSRFSEVDKWLQPVSLAIVALAVGGYLYRLYRARHRG
jgi:membrane protein DedA with SNARE-associated domain